MKQKTVYLLSGLPASGKTHWVNLRCDANDRHHSRDEVRFRFLKPEDDYFKYEDLVFKTWIEEINKSLADPEVENIYVDATHLNNKSRDKTIRNLVGLENAEIVNVVFVTPLSVCLERNSWREGLRRVPKETIIEMTYRVETPNKYKTIYIDEKGWMYYGV